MNLRQHVALVLNSDYERIPDFFRTAPSDEKPRKRAHAIIQFNREIIRATKSFVCAYIIKPEVYAGLGSDGTFILLSTMMDVGIESPRTPVILDTRETPADFQESISEETTTVGFVLDPTKMVWGNMHRGVISNHDFESSKIRDAVGHDVVIYIEDFTAEHGRIKNQISVAQNKYGSGFIVGIGDEALYANNSREFATTACHLVLQLTDVVSDCLDVKCATCGSKMRTRYGLWVCENGHHTTPFI